MNYIWNIYELFYIDLTHIIVELRRDYYMKEVYVQHVASK